MSRSQDLIINCGASHVTACAFSTAGGEIRLEKVAGEVLDYDYSEEGAWLDAVGSALRKLSRESGLSGSARFIVPGSQTLTKTIRVPHVEKGKQAQVIAFEAQQNIPYPLGEVVWDSQIVGDDGVETEVLFIAAKKDVIDGFCARVRQAGFVPEAIGASPVLDYNALRHAYPSLEGETLVVNIGARSTTLLFSAGDGFFVRNITLGGNSLTQHLADSLGKSFAQAEEIKCKFFAEGANFSDEDSGSKLLTSNAQAFMRRMGQEITRSIVNFKRQKDGESPKRILLTGRGSLLKGLSDHLGSTQKVEVEMFDPLKNVALESGVAPSGEQRLQLSEIVGEAVRPFVDGGAGVDLLPGELRSEMDFSRRKPFLLLAAACLALAPFGPWMALRQQAGNIENRAETVSGEVMSLQSLAGRIADNQERALALSASIQQVEGLVNSKSNWIRFFAKLQESLEQAKDVWLDELEVIREPAGAGESRYEVALKGQMLVREAAGAEPGAIDQDAIARRISSIRDSFVRSEFIVSAKPPVITWTSLQQGLKVLPFRINLVVNRSKPI